MNGSCCRRHRRVHRPDGNPAEDGCRRDGQGRPGRDRTYTIASRCGVLPKRHPAPHQPGCAGGRHRGLHLSGRRQPDHCGPGPGRPIKGNILYLGGPLTFSETLRRALTRLWVSPAPCRRTAFSSSPWALRSTPTRNPTCARLPSAWTTTAPQRPTSACRRCSQTNRSTKTSARHLKATVPCLPFGADCGPVHIGIDSGSTTIKLVVIDNDANILFERYRPNLNSRFRSSGIRCSVSTGSPGPADCQRDHHRLRRGARQNAFHCDRGLVETVAHFTAAKHFCPTWISSSTLAARTSSASRSRMVPSATSS